MKERTLKKEHSRQAREMRKAEKRYKGFHRRWWLEGKHGKPGWAATI